MRRPYDHLLAFTQSEGPTGHSQYLFSKPGLGISNYLKSEVRNTDQNNLRETGEIRTTFKKSVDSGRMACNYKHSDVPH